jgi:Family of unknown function (DUF6492)
MNSHEFVLVCKSYLGDIRRLERLLSSIQQYNSDAIPVFIIVPNADLELSQYQIKNLALDSTKYTWLTDEDVVNAHPQAISHRLMDKYRAAPGSVSQQIIKSEAWRAISCTAYLSLDSDSIFLKPFCKSDFLTVDGAPYTVMHQAKDLYQLVINKGYTKQYAHFLNIAQTTQKHFGRQGPTYSFSPQPYLWSRKVWNDLYEQWLEPRHQTLWDALEICPFEAHWYGEALLHFKSIPVVPIEPILRVYHFDWQFDLQQKQGERADLLNQQYLGVCLQSNWEVDMDAKGKRSTASKIVRSIKRFLKKFR